MKKLQLINPDESHVMILTVKGFEKSPQRNNPIAIVETMSIIKVAAYKNVRGGVIIVETKSYYDYSKQFHQ